MIREEKKPTIFFLGDVALDEYYEAPYWPRLKEKIVVHSLPSQPGGMIANAACMAAALGADSHFCALLNEGEISRRLIEDLENQGVCTDWILFDPAVPDSKTIIILAEGEHTVIIPTLGIQVIHLPEKTYENIQRADYLYTTLCEFQPVECGGKGSLELLKEIRQSGCQIVFDMDVNGFAGAEWEYLRHIDILFMNEKGFSSLAGEESEKMQAKKILDAGVRILVITQGSNGCSVFSESDCISVPGIQTDVIDVTGAGDTFSAAFIYAYHRWESLEKAAQFAVGAATRCVERMGARGGIAGAAEILEYIKCKGTPIPE